jgi:hypothetical protein
MKRITAHLIEAHHFTPDAPRVVANPYMTHDIDHGMATFAHPIDDLYLTVEDEDDTSDPDQEVSA